MASLIREPALEFATGQTCTVQLSPLTLPTGRLVTDFDEFWLAVREDPQWPRVGGDVPAADTADPIADGWAMPADFPVEGTVVSGVVTFSFVMADGAGVRRYSLDAWGVIGTAEIQLVRATWLTGGARVWAGL